MMNMKAAADLTARLGRARLVATIENKSTRESRGALVFDRHDQPPGRRRRPSDRRRFSHRFVPSYLHGDALVAIAALNRAQIAWIRSPDATTGSMNWRYASS